VLVIASAVALTGAVTAAPGTAGEASPPALTGNATPAVDPVPHGEVAVVAASAPVDDTVAFVLENGTEGPVRVAKVTAVAAREDGTRAVRASTKKVVPLRLAPGERAIGRVSFRKASIGPAPVLTWHVTAGRAPAGPDPTRLAVSNPVLSPPMGAKVAQTLDLDVENPHDDAVRGPLVVNVLCLNEASRPAVLAGASARRAKLAAGATAHVTVKLRELCPSFVVGARGRFDR
jgi:hypothetical protein